MTLQNKGADVCSEQRTCAIPTSLKTKLVLRKKNNNNIRAQTDEIFPFQICFSWQSLSSAPGTDAGLTGFEWLDPFFVSLLWISNWLSFVELRGELLTLWLMHREEEQHSPPGPGRAAPALKKTVVCRPRDKPSLSLFFLWLLLSHNASIFSFSPSSLDSQLRKYFPPTHADTHTDCDGLQMPSCAYTLVLLVLCWQKISPLKTQQWMTCVSSPSPDRKSWVCTGNPLHHAALFANTYSWYQEL